LNAQGVKWYWDAGLSASRATEKVEKEYRLFFDTFWASPSSSRRHSALLMTALWASFPEPGKYLMGIFPSVAVTARSGFLGDGKTSKSFVTQERV